MGLAVVTEKTIAKNLSSMAHNIFKKEITWFKVVGSITSALHCTVVTRLPVSTTWCRLWRWTA